VQDPSAADRGLVVAMRNVYNNESTVEYDAYDLLPVKVTDALGMEVTSENDYRVLSPLQMTDPNENVTKVAFNALGLVSKIALCGKDNGANGDTLAVPGTSFAYDFFAFVNDSDPISVRKTVRENHINAPYISSLPPAEQNATIASTEYSDGYGRIVQSRAQAEDIIFGTLAAACPPAVGGRPKARPSMHRAMWCRPPGTKPSTMAPLMNTTKAAPSTL